LGRLVVAAGAVILPWQHHPLCIWRGGVHVLFLTCLLSHRDHRSIISTTAFTALAPNRLKDFWRD
jgi:hypothetical protein